MTSMREIMRALLRLEREDLLDRLVELGDLRLQQLVAPVLRVDHRADREVREQRDDAREAGGRADADEELFPAPLAECLPPGQ